MAFKRAIVTAVGPLRILIDGDTVAIPFTPKSLIDPATLTVGDVVHADQSGHRLVVLGRVGGINVPMGRVVRSSATPSVASGSYTDISGNANWSTATPDARNEGFAAYSNGWTIPASGLYRVSFSTVNTGNVGILSGVSVNKSSGIGYTDLLGIISTAPVGTVTGATGSFEQHFTVGDVLRLFAYGGGGSPSLTASMGAFSVTWVRA